MDTSSRLHGQPAERGGSSTCVRERFRVGLLLTVGLFAALLLGAAAGCSGQQSDDDPTPDLSGVQTTGEIDSTGTSSDSGNAVATTTTARVRVTRTTGGSTKDGGGAAEPQGPVGSRGNPIPPGQEAMMGDWRVILTGVTLDATLAVLDENMFNDTPETGSQYVLVGVRATYEGQDSSTFWIDLMYKFVGSLGNTFDAAPVVAPESIIHEGEVFSGASISGNLVFMVASDQVSGGTLMLQEAFSLKESRVFFALE